MSESVDKSADAPWLPSQRKAVPLGHAGANDIVLKDGTVLQSGTTAWAVFVAARNFVASGTIPRQADLQRRVAEMVGGNPSMTTVNKYYNIWQAQELKPAFSSPEGNIPGMKAPVSVRTQALESVEALYQLCLDEARASLAEREALCNRQVELANEEVSKAQRAQQASFDDAARAMDEVRLVRQQAAEASEQAGANKALLLREQELHNATKATMAAQSRELADKVSTLDRTINEIEGARKSMMVELANLRDAKKRLEAANLQISAELATAKSEVSRLSEHVKLLEPQIRTAQEAGLRFKTLYETAKEQGDQERKTTTALQTELGGLRERFKEKEALVGRLTLDLQERSIEYTRARTETEAALLKARAQRKRALVRARSRKPVIWTKAVKAARKSK